MSHVADAKNLHYIDGTPCFFIDNYDLLNLTYSSDPYLSPIGRQDKESPTFVALDCEGVPDALELIQVATPSTIYIFDCQSLGVQKVCQTLQPLLTSENCVKLIHDLHQDAVALATHGGVASLNGVLDTQLLGEYLWGELHIGFNSLLSKLNLQTHPSKAFVHAKMKSGVNLWKERPIPWNYL
jgi:hypothetical protein